MSFNGGAFTAHMPTRSMSQQDLVLSSKVMFKVNKDKSVNMVCGNYFVETNLYADEYTPNLSRSVVAGGVLYSLDNSNIYMDGEYGIPYKIELSGSDMSSIIFETVNVPGKDFGMGFAYRWIDGEKKGRVPVIPGSTFVDMGNSSGPKLASIEIHNQAAAFNNAVRQNMNKY